MSADDDTSDRSTALTIAAIGGGAALLWLLFRGKGLGWGGGRRKAGDGDGASTSGSADRRVTIWVRAHDRIDVDKVPTDLATALALARAAGQAELHVTGDARTGWLHEVGRALLGSGVRLWLDSDININELLLPAETRPIDINDLLRMPTEDSIKDFLQKDSKTPKEVIDRRSTSSGAPGTLRNARAFLSEIRNAAGRSSREACPPRLVGGGYLVRSSYRVHPFLADDVILVRDNTSKRVVGFAYDTYWQARIAERNGWLDRDTLSPILEPGMRVELSPVCPLWKAGAKYGIVHQVTKSWTVIVKMDDPNVRGLQRFTDHTLLTILDDGPQSKNE